VIHDNQPGALLHQLVICHFLTFICGEEPAWLMGKNQVKRWETFMQEFRKYANMP
jgi:hypothetical protein